MRLVLIASTIVFVSPVASASPATPRAVLARAARPLAVAGQRIKAFAARAKVARQARYEQKLVTRAAHQHPAEARVLQRFAEAVAELDGRTQAGVQAMLSLKEQQLGVSREAQSARSAQRGAALSALAGVGIVGGLALLHPLAAAAGLVPGGAMGYAAEDMSAQARRSERRFMQKKAQAAQETQRWLEGLATPASAR